MADTVRKVQYFKVAVPNRAGEAHRVLRAIAASGVNLAAFHGFPEGRGSQLDLVPSDVGALKTAARAAGIKLGAAKTCFLAQGDDRPGALAALLAKLAAARVNVIAVTGIAAGAGRWGAILWVDTRKVGKAAKALGLA
jgi:prephenate dehydratase